MANEALHLRATVTAPSALSTIYVTESSSNDGQVPIVNLTTPLGFGYNVKDSTFGAIGDGSTDDTAAIHAARDAAGVGGTVYFPDGTYNTNALTASVASQKWIGSGGASIIVNNSSTSEGIIITAAGVTIDNLDIDANGTGGATGQGIHISGVANVTIQNLTIDDSPSWGISGNNTDYAKVINCRITESSDVGIFMDSGDTADHIGNEYRDNFIDRSGQGAGIAGGGIQVRAETGQVARNYIIKNNNVLLPNNATDGLCIETRHAHGVVVMGNRVNGGSMGISIDGPSDYAVITGNYVYDFRLNGIESPATDFITITGNTIDANSNGDRGIAVSNTPATSFGTISGNTITGITGTDNSAIYLLDAINMTVTGNSIHVPNVDTTGVLVAGSDDTVITGNMFYGGNTAGRAIQFDGSNYATVTGNHFHDFDAVAPIHAFASDAVEYDFFTISGNTLRTQNSSKEMVIPSYSGSATMGIHWVIKGNAGAERSGFSFDVLDLNNDVIDAWGSGTPESSLIASPSSIFRRIDGATDTILYTKASGTSNTGWVAVNNV